MQYERSSPSGQMELLLSSWQTTIRFTVVHASHRAQGGTARGRCAPRFAKGRFDRVFRHYAVQNSFLLSLPPRASITSHQRD